jgi:uncharacterized protein YeaO (DUF488 family)
MIKIKHLMDAVENDDGARLWVEPIGLTKDFRAWCEVDHVVSHLGPPMGLWQWFAEHPDGYGYFRATYHDYLTRSRLRPALMELAHAAQKENFTLIHQGDDEEHNTAIALLEFLSELGSYCPKPNDPPEAQAD